MSLFNDDLYIDLLISNSIQTNANSRVPVQFSQNSSQTILNSTNGYKFSIIRFALNTETLPIFIPTMKSDNTTIYSITMELDGVQFQQFMEFEPQNINPIEPEEYYYVYSYQYLIYLVNKCFSSCLNGLTSSIDDPPKMSYDGTTQKCTISLDNSIYGYNESTKINIYMNFAMYALFASIPAMLLNTNNLGMDYQINNLISSNTSILTQDNSTIAIWNPVGSVIFTSNLLPIYQSQTPPIQIYKEGSVSNTSSSFGFLNILTDFLGNDLQFVPFIQYAPTIYRYLSLKANTEIKNIDLQVFWMEKNSGLLKRVYLGVGGACSIKLFLTKNF